MRILFILVLSFVTAQAFACDAYEAQVAAEVKEVKMTETGCEVKLDFIYFGAHFFCPLLEEDVTNKSLKMDAESCSVVEASDKVSGILVYNLDLDSYSLED